MQGPLRESVPRFQTGPCLRRGDGIFDIPHSRAPCIARALPTSSAIETRDNWASAFDPIADIPLLRQIGRMTGKKIIALSWWTFAYILLAGALFGFSAMGKK